MVINIYRVQSAGNMKDLQAPRLFAHINAGTVLLTRNKFAMSGLSPDQNTKKFKETLIVFITRSIANKLM